MRDPQFSFNNRIILFYWLNTAKTSSCQQFGQTARLFVSFVLLSILLVFTSHHHNWLMIQINHETRQPRDGNYQLWQMVFTESEALSVKRGVGLILIQHGMEISSLSNIWSHIPNASAELRVFALRQASVSQYNSAARLYEISGLIDTDLADPWYFAGEMYMEAGDFSAAMKAYELALKRQEIDQVGQSDIQLRLGDAYRLLGNAPTAIMIYSNAIQLGDFRIKSVAEAYFKRAEVYRNNHLFNLALQDYRLVLHQQPRNYWAHIHTGWLTWQVNRDWQEAITLLEDAIDLEPDMRWGYRTLADVYAAMDEVDRAIHLYEQVLDLYPQDEYAAIQLDELRADE